MTRTPVLLRRRGDPLDHLREVVERYEAHARTARNRYLRGMATSVRARGQSRRTLLVMAAAGVDGLRLEQLDRDGLELLPDSELAVAAERAGLDGFDLSGVDAERVRGALTALRGSVGEQWVLDRLRDGHLPVPDGTVAAQMLPFTTPGVDLVFTDATGAATGSANVKIAATADVVLRHFERHPDVSVVYATTDAASDAAARGVQVVGLDTALPGSTPVVVDIGRSSGDFDRQIGEALTGRTSVLSAGIDGIDAIGLIPWASSAAIAVRALLRWRAGAAAAEVAHHAGREATAAAAATAAAHVASRLTSSEPTVALAAIATSALTLGALDVRRSWTGLSTELAYLTEVAEQVAQSNKLARSRSAECAKGAQDLT